MNDDFLVVPLWEILDMLLRLRNRPNLKKDIDNRIVQFWDRLYNQMLRLL